ncbi:YqaJ viral recombinase family protein [Blautia coccoides]|uniref:YqaJ viral recombinase family protein n=1 Tax=Blautia hominis TaxID=2025493 RepID=A0ABQ0BL21_9FIRM|nr:MULTISPECIES: YqaJ viral recombinase family protein [Blautia]MCB5873724.1 YqaJ viral recombinase family protein [Blautia producta]MCQ4640916.1 YqaJ viral recombinase family protein [Blautia coccoides]
MAALNLKYEPQIFADTSHMSREEWLRTRRDGIGGSEASIIMGVSPFATRRDLYYDKRGIKPANMDPEEENWVAKEVGNRLEELVAVMFSKKTGLEVFPDKHMYFHPLFPFMKADLDFEIYLPTGKKGILECKTTNYNCQYKWHDNAVPVNYEWQCRHYMAVMNVDVVYIACLYGNNDSEYFIRKIERDLDIEQELIKAEQEFWENYVQAGVEPPYTEAPDLVLESLRKFVGPADQKLPPITITADEKGKLEQYLALAERKAKLDKERREIEKEQKEISIPFVEQLGQCCQAVITDGSVAYRILYNPTNRKTVKKENITKLENLYPEAYADVVTESVSRTFRIRKEAA